MNERDLMLRDHPEWGSDELDLVEWLSSQSEMMDAAARMFRRPDPDTGYIDVCERDHAFAELVVFILHRARHHIHRRADADTCSSSSPRLQREIYRQE